MSKHTPGPWVIKEIDHDEGARVSFGLVGCGCRVYGMPEGEANARLIAAAPDLLAALESCAAECERAANALGGRESSPLVAGCLLNRAAEARAAIAKATQACAPTSTSGGEWAHRVEG